MKNNKGFIATSILYSFFIIFLGLFLGIIAEYLQNKVHLNSIESGIKKEINTTMGIGDFKIGDKVRVTDPTELTTNSTESITSSSLDNSTVEIIDIYDIDSTNKGCLIFSKKDDGTLNSYLCLNGKRINKTINNQGVIEITGVAS